MGRRGFGLGRRRGRGLDDGVCCDGMDGRWMIYRWSSIELEARRESIASMMMMHFGGVNMSVQVGGDKGSKYGSDYSMLLRSDSIL